MKKKLLAILISILAVCTVVFTLSACEMEPLDPSETPSTEEGSDNTGDEYGSISFSTLTVNGENVSKTLPNGTTSFDFKTEIQKTGKANFILSENSNGTNAIITGVVDLDVGNNRYYVLETVSGTWTGKTYIVDLYRNYMYTVDFNTYGLVDVSSQQVEEGNFAQEPLNIEGNGFTINDWDFDFETPITSDITIDALIEFENYSISYNLNGGALSTDKNSYTIVDEVTFDIPTKDGYNFMGWYESADFSGSSITGIEKGTFRNITLYAKWSEPIFTTKNGSITGLTLYGKTLTSIVIPEKIDGETITSIGESAFYNCRSLESITIPNSVTSIGSIAFRYCISLTSITVDENNIAYKSIDGNLYSKDGKTLIQYAIGKTQTSFTIPNSVTSIGDRAFSFCRSLTSIEIPNSVTSIGYSAFYYCPQLKSITIPNSVTSIGEEAFYDCDTLTSVTIPNSVTSIGSYAFDDCTQLTIYCEAKEKPSGWHSYWNNSNRPVVWDYKNNNN